ncbi:MAG: P-II family nitrogen regulator [Nitrospiria bacterium]
MREKITAPSAPLQPVKGEVDASLSKRERSAVQRGVLKEVIAIVRLSKHIITRRALEAAGVFSYTTSTVLGRSHQRGLRFQSTTEEEVSIKFLPKQYFSIVIPEEQLSAAVAVLIKANRTGQGAVGDGRIFVVDVDDAIRISTDERRAEAI